MSLYADLNINSRQIPAGLDTGANPPRRTQVPIRIWQIDLNYAQGKKFRDLISLSAYYGNLMTSLEVIKWDIDL